jgi:hypothetical protein
VATRAPARPSWAVSSREAIGVGAYALGAVALAGEAAVHIQQYAALFHDVRWIGPLFLANAAASVVVMAGLAYGRTRHLAALAGIVVSAIALGSLVVSYGRGLFGWQEGGFRTPVELALIAEVAAVILLSVGLAVRAMLAGEREA